MIAGFLIMLHGSQKLFDLPAGQVPSPELLSLFGAAGILEFFGGLLLLTGLFTRPAAFILSGEMALAYFLMQQPHGLLPLQNHGELPALYSFIFLYLSVAGDGEWSADSSMREAALSASSTPEDVDPAKRLGLYIATTKK